TATGTITVKRAPAGWEKAFAGTNYAAYRAIDPTSTRILLCVADGTTSGRVAGYARMCDAYPGATAFPLGTQLAGGRFWPNANAANATARAWTLIADSRGWWLHIHTHTSNPGSSGSVWGFGDYDSYKSGDPFACALQCSVTDTSGSTSVIGEAAEYSGQGSTAG